ncbi:AAA family ATPase [Shewanella frigidimarina]|uniref:AAA family ATPase n=1 Tax=Shewanella frigidimarina TaxID=56812 RepID=UPI003D7AA411
MTQFKPYLIVNRLVVTKGSKHVYDEFFREGVNIVCGKNSSGKSTISDFIFYGLGGDLSKWKAEAKSCDYVYLEVNLSGKIFTLKREIKESGRSGMDLFGDTFENANLAPNTEWLRYQYNATDKESFYQAIFKELGIPYSKSDDKGSITMHQLLRMMYVDQMTSPDRLFKFDNFDSPNKRKAIGELLIGLSDFSLYEKRVELQKISSILDSSIKEIKTIHRFLGSEIKTLKEIDEEIDDRNSEIIVIEKVIDVLSNASASNIEDDDNIINALSQNIFDLRSKRTELISRHSATNFEINDSQLFIKSLAARLVALTETNKTINALSDIAFHHCPACQVKVLKKDLGCSLCGCSELKLEIDIDPTFKVRKEIEFQIAESKKLIDIKTKRLADLSVNITQITTELHSNEQEFDSYKRPQRSLSLELRNKFKEIGSLRNQIVELNGSKDKYGKLHELYEQKDDVQKQVNILKNEISLKEAKIENEIKSKKSVLSKITLDIIRADNDHEELFVRGKKVEFDFGEDRVTIDERALFSASSMVYLKNAFRLALLKASCIDPTYLYPRFLLMDNIEDKGMEEVRSQLFQNEIIKLSKTITVKHQIIFTTSMIDPKLKGSVYCIGKYHDDKNKTLQF